MSVNVNGKEVYSMYVGNQRVQYAYLGNRKLYGSEHDLPADYREVDWIANPNEGAIFSVFKYNPLIHEIDINLRQEFVTSAKLQYILGGGQISKYGGLSLSLNALRLGIDGSNYTTDSFSADYVGKDVNIKITPYSGGYQVTFNNTVVASHTNLSWNSENSALNSRVLFANDSVSTRFLGRVYWFRVKNIDTGNYVINYIPCVRVNDGKVGFYDLVSNTFITKTVGGNFVALPEWYEETLYILNPFLGAVDTLIPWESNLDGIVCKYLTTPRDIHMAKVNGDNGHDVTVFGILGTDTSTYKHTYRKYIVNSSPTLSVMTVCLGYVTENNTISIMYTTGGSTSYNDTVFSISNKPSDPSYQIYKNGTVTYTYSNTTDYNNLARGTYPGLTHQIYRSNATPTNYTIGRSKIYYYLGLDSDVNIAGELIPCVNKTNGKVGMYDIINNVFVSSVNDTTTPLIKNSDEHKLVDYIENVNAGYIERIFVYDPKKHEVEISFINNTSDTMGILSTTDTNSKYGVLKVFNNQLTVGTGIDALWHAFTAPIGEVTTIKVYPYGTGYRVEKNGIVIATRLNITWDETNKTTVVRNLFSNSAPIFTGKFVGLKVTDISTKEVIQILKPAKLKNLGILWDAVLNDYICTQSGKVLTCGPELPYDEEVEYLESTGTLYIDTGTYGYMNHTYELDFQLTVINKYINWGARSLANISGLNMTFTYSGSQIPTWLFRWESRSNNDASQFLPQIDTNRHVLKISNGIPYFDNIEKSGTAGHNSDFHLDYNLFLFAGNAYDSGAVDKSHARIYSYKDIDLNGNMVRDFIPVRKDGIGYMYDRVTRLLFGNQGTGNFIIGPDKNLPYDSEIEYLGSTGTLYIDTEINGQSVNRFIIEGTCERINSSTSSQILGGTSSTNGTFFGGYYIGGWHCGNGLGISTNRSIIDLEISNNIRGTLTDKVTNQELEFNNIAFGLLSFPNENLLLFGGHLNRHSPNATCYNLKLYTSAGLVRDFIPVRKGNIGYMYDKITRKLFANAGTGNFVLGEDKVPYLRIEYLESSGTLYIDTGISPTTDTEVYLKASINSFTTYGFICGARTGSDYSNRFMPLGETDTNGYMRFVYGSAPGVSSGVTYGTVYEIMFNKTSTHKLYLNDTEITTLSGYVKSNNNTLYLFACSGYENNLYCGSGSIYNCIIKETGTVIMNLIPVRVGNVGYMYDKVSGKLFGNSGTGNFTLGPDLT